MHEEADRRVGRGRPPTRGRDGREAFGEVRHRPALPGPTPRLGPPSRGTIVVDDAATGISLHAVRTADLVSLVAILDVNGTSAVEGAVVDVLTASLTAVGSRHAAMA